MSQDCKQKESQLCLANNDIEKRKKQMFLHLDSDEKYWSKKMRK